MSRRNLGTISDTSPAAPGTAAGDTIQGLEDVDTITIIATLAGATGGTLDVYLQTSFDGGTVWVDMAHFPQLAAAAASSVRVWQLCRNVVHSTLATVGSGTVAAPGVALAANTVVNCWGDRIRAVYVAGGGTTLGAAVDIKLASWVK
jgi:hypothetical protein